MNERRVTSDVLVFDFDGTLVNSMEAFADIAAEVMPRRLPVDSAEARRLYLETSGLPFFQQLEALFPGDPANAATAQEFEKTKLAGYFREPLFEDAPETLAYLKGRGIRMAISSNNFQELVERYVNNAGLEFDMVMGFKENFEKGEDHFAAVERKFCVDRSSIAFVGDSIKDGERARDSGITFIGKEGTFTRHQFIEKFGDVKVIANLSELKGMF
ncbi:MAG: HAD hydrolase-like protein [Pseudomonadota bacterium]